MMQPAVEGQVQVEGAGEGEVMAQHALAIGNHRKACDGFSAVVAQGTGLWTSPSPCTEWDARGVVEHVIGFHDELLLRPTGTSPTHPDDDPIARWAATAAAIDLAMEVAAADGSGDQPNRSDVNLDRLLPALTGEVLAHTWDLAKALAVDPNLDAALCQVSYNFLRANEDKVRATGLFGAAVPVPGTADAASQFVAFIGRDPGWTL